MSNAQIRKLLTVVTAVAAVYVAVKRPTPRTLLNAAVAVGAL